MLNSVSKEMQTYAFFDVDDTIIKQKSMLNFIQLHFKKTNDKKLQKEFYKEINALIKSDASWEIANKVYYSYFSNFNILSVRETINSWVDVNIKNLSNFYNKNIIKTLREHQSNGVECVFVSGSFRELLQPIADDLGVDHILSINLERDNDRYTGNILPPQTIGNGKAEAMRQFIQGKNSHLSDCYAYGDDISDVPMLEIVGNPVAVSGGRRLESYAQEKGWRIITPN